MVVPRVECVYPTLVGFTPDQTGRARALVLALEVHYGRTALNVVVTATGSQRGIAMVRLSRISRVARAKAAAVTGMTLRAAPKPTTSAVDEVDE